MRSPKRTLALLFLAGLLIGESDPVGHAAWRLIGAWLPGLKVDSLAAPSPFEQLPESRWIAETEHAFAIEDRYAPMAPVHLLVISKERYASILDAPEPVMGEMLALARDLARDHQIAEDGFRIMINTNPKGTQTVYHLHVHVMGGRQMTEPLLHILWGRLTHLDG
ncbi:MAG: HIT domain-containing protein [bacterium]|nr:HIT domain-containing protein [bacterium]MCP5067701.1 HIT domain-containing protein [bacterium]